MIANNKATLRALAIVIAALLSSITTLGAQTRVEVRLPPELKQEAQECAALERAVRRILDVYGRRYEYARRPFGTAIALLVHARLRSGPTARWRGESRVAQVDAQEGKIAHRATRSDGPRTV